MFVVTQLLEISGQWSTSKAKPLSECVSALVGSLVAVDALQNSMGQWRLMRSGPTELDAEVALTEDAVLSVVLDGRRGRVQSDPEDDAFGYFFNLEYLGPIPVSIRGNVASLLGDGTTDYFFLHFTNGDGFPEVGPDIGFVEELFHRLVGLWQPQVAVCGTMKLRFANPFDGAGFPALGWLQYFSEPAVMSLVEDLGTPYASGVLVKTRERYDEVTESDIIALANELHRREIENVIYHDN